MHHMRLWASAGIIALIVIAGFALSVPHTRDLAVIPKEPDATSSVPTVRVRDSYKKGVHTITGSILAPNACTAVEASASLEGSAPGSVRILLSISLPVDTGICLQIPTDIVFQTTVSGPASAPITVTVNGAVASTTSP